MLFSFNPPFRPSFSLNIDDLPNNSDQWYDVASRWAPYDMAAVVLAYYGGGESQSPVLRIIDMASNTVVAGRELAEDEILLPNQDSSASYYTATLPSTGSGTVSIKVYSLLPGTDQITQQGSTFNLTLPEDVFLYPGTALMGFVPATADSSGLVLTNAYGTIQALAFDATGQSQSIDLPEGFWVSGNGFTSADNTFYIQLVNNPINPHIASLVDGGIPVPQYFKLELGGEAPQWTPVDSQEYFQTQYTSYGADRFLRDGNDVIDLGELVAPGFDFDLIANETLPDGSLLVRLTEWSNEDDSVGYERWVVITDGDVVANKAFEGNPGLRSLQDGVANTITFQQIDFAADPDTQALVQGNNITVHQIALADIGSVLQNLPSNSTTIASADNQVASYTRAQLVAATDAQGNPFALQPDNIVALSHYMHANNRTLLGVETFFLNDDEGGVPFLAVVNSDHETVHAIALPGWLDSRIFTDHNPNSPVYLVNTANSDQDASFLYNATTNQLVSVNSQSYRDVAQNNGRFTAQLGTTDDDTLSAANNVYLFASTLDGDDTVTVPNAGGSITTGSGNDTIIAGSGVNSINGESGTDTVSYHTRSQGIQIDAVSATLVYAHTQGQISDELRHIERVIGTQHNDIFFARTGAVANFVGGAGDDSFNAAVGANITVSYAGNFADYTVNLLYGTSIEIIDTNAEDGDEGTDTLTGITTLTFADQSFTLIQTINGTAQADTISTVGLEEEALRFDINAGDGNDTIELGNADHIVNAGDGNDTILLGNGEHNVNGGSGTDTVSFAAHESRVNVYYSSGDNPGFTWDGGQLFNIETIIGTAHDDWLNLWGVEQAVTLFGAQGDDSINTNSPASMASPVMVTVAYAGNRADYSVSRSGYSWQVTDNNTVNGDEGTDTINGLVRLQFADITINPTLSLNGTTGNDTLSTTASSNLHEYMVSAGDGNDTIAMGMTSHMVWGGAGADHVDYSTSDFAATFTIAHASESEFGGTNVLRWGQMPDDSMVSFSDRLFDVEVFTGTQHDDRFDIYQGESNVIDSAITLVGGAGNDTVRGFADVTQLVTVRYAGNFADYSFEVNVGDNAKQWTVTDNNTANGDEGTDTLMHVGFLEFADRKINLATFDPDKAVANDFDGDGRSDILWRNSATGSNLFWSGANSANKVSIGGMSDLDWKVVGVGDFDGNGQSDILWRNTVTGGNVVWDNGFSASKRSIGGVRDLDWQVVAVADFAGDGRADILWRHAVTGSNVVWQNGISTNKLSVGGVRDINWQVAGTGDFDGDGRADILWRNSATGGNLVWSGGSSSSKISIGGLSDQNWQVAGVGDFNGDGRDDILWRNTATGGNVVWDSGLAANKHSIGGVRDTNWQVVQVGDFFGDGQADILWRHAMTGSNVVWNNGNSEDKVSVGGVRDPNALVMAGQSGSTLLGGSGNNTLFGSALNDRLLGGAGDDVLTGGAGADQFVFNSLVGIDIIKDFSAGSDKLVFDSSVFTGLTTENAAERISVNAQGQLMYDADGSGEGEAQHIATLQNNGSLVAVLNTSDYLVI